MSKTVHVDLGDRSYPIYIGQSVLSKEALAKHIPNKEVLIVSNTTVAPLYLDEVKAMLSDFSVETVILDDGEKYKNLDSIQKIYDVLLNAQFSRQVTLIALGGGVIGDMTGFAAATYQRGVHFIQIPTTLLSQVDSSVGGKTGVNHPLGKNMIGAFYQPRAVFIQTSYLQTLPEKEFSAGMAEVIKYGLLGDAEFVDYLTNNMIDLLAQNEEVLKEIIARSCQKKAQIVAEDERESGVRALLNLGHSFGHAIESLLSYKGFLHGEAVAVGMLMAASLSQQMGLISTQDVDKVRTLLVDAKLPVQVPAGIKASEFRNAMQVDKKNIAGRLRLILLNSIGHAYIDANVDEQKLMHVLESYCES